MTQTTEKDHQEMTIILDNHSPAYCGGQQISGKVQIKSNADTRTKGLVVKLEGKVNVWWSKEKKDKSILGRDGQQTEQIITKFYDNFDTIFVLERYLLSDGEKEVRISTGVSTYGFSFRLPKEIPMTYKSQNGKIDYFLEADLVRPYLKSDLETVLHFTVNTVLDLNEIPEAKEQGEWSIVKNKCCLCFGIGPIEITVRLSKQGFIPGDVILAEVDTNNMSSQPMKNILAELIDVTKYTATNDSLETTTTITSVTSEEVVPPGEQQAWTAPLRVPSVPPTSLGGCKIIDLKYYVRVTASFYRKTTDIQLLCPVTIGTVALKNKPTNKIPPKTDSRIQLAPSPSPPKKSIESSTKQSGLTPKSNTQSIKGSQLTRKTVTTDNRKTTVGSKVGSNLSSTALQPPKK